DDIKRVELTQTGYQRIHDLGSTAESHQTSRSRSVTFSRWRTLRETRTRLWTIAVPPIKQSLTPIGVPSFWNLAAMSGFADNGSIDIKPADQRENLRL